MIFVTLGTQDKSFQRLLEKIEECIESGIIKEEVIVQAGVTDFTSKNMQIYKFLSMEDFYKYMDDASLIITHGGVGNILNGLKKGKKIIASPRLKKYDEHESDHQIQIVDKFSKEGYILKLDEFDKLSDKLQDIKTHKFKKFKSNNDNFVNMIDVMIQDFKL